MPRSPASPLPLLSTFVDAVALCGAHQPCAHLRSYDRLEIIFGRPQTWQHPSSNHPPIPISKVLHQSHPFLFPQVSCAAERLLRKTLQLLHRTHMNNSDRYTVHCVTYLVYLSVIRYQNWEVPRHFSQRWEVISSQRSSLEAGSMLVKRGHQTGCPPISTPPPCEIREVGTSAREHVGSQMPC